MRAGPGDGEENHRYPVGCHDLVAEHRSQGADGDDGKRDAHEDPGQALPDEERAEDQAQGRDTGTDAAATINNVAYTGQGNRFTIADNGVGFPPDLRRADAGGLGLLSMKERVALIGGTLTIDSALGAGTTLQASIPLMEEP